MPTPTDPTPRALALARDLLAVLPEVLELLNRSQRLPPEDLTLVRPGLVGPVGFSTPQD
jgi:hypothetical protein